MRKRRWIMAAGLLVLLGAGSIGYWFYLLPRPAGEDADYPLRPVSVFEEDGCSNIQYLARGQTAWWRAGPDRNVIWVAKATDWKTVPHPEVKAYPKLKSSRPLFGAIDFGKGRIEPGKGAPYYFVVDESQGAHRGYDRLYFDLNHDGDLTNDLPTAPLENPPSPSHPNHGWNKEVVFPPLDIPFDFGQGYGTMAVRILPRLSMYGNEQFQMFFVATEARKGTIQIGRHRFQAILSQSDLIAGRYDARATELRLLTAGSPPVQLWQRWWGDEALSSLRLVDGKFYSLAANPTGDTLMVRRYRGELGVLRVEPGNRKVSEVAMSGSLSSEKTIVPVGRLPHADSELEKVRDCELPVGDYCPTEMSFRYGRLACWLSDNYHTDGKRGGAMQTPRLYSIKIRKDQPFVLDFGHRPEVMFASPAKDQTFKTGEEVRVHAVLVDPVLDTMIRELRDTTRKTTRDFFGKSIEEDVSLAPTVTISDSSGKAVAQGTMPYG
jgi:hypothetical protein